MDAGDGTPDGLRRDGPPAPPAPEAWKRRGIERVFGPKVYLAFALLTAAAGIAMTIGRDAAGPATAAFGLALVCVYPAMLPRRPGVEPVVSQVAGTAESGLVFRRSRARVRSVVGGLGLFGLSFALMWASVEAFVDGADDRFLRIVAPLGAVLFGAMFVNGLRGLDGGQLALTPRGVRFSQGGSVFFVPWESIVGVRATAMRSRPGGGREPLIGMDLTTRDAVETSAVSRLLLKLTPRAYGDVTVAPRLFEVDPALVLATLRHFHENPAERQDLGSERALQRFGAIARPG